MTEPREFKTNDANLEGRSVQSIATEYDITVSTLRSRMKRNPHAPIELLLHPVSKVHSHRVSRVYTYKGVTKTESEWAVFVGISRSAMKRRFQIYPTVAMAIEYAKGEHLRKRSTKSKRSASKWDIPLVTTDPLYEIKNRIRAWKGEGMKNDEILVKFKSTFTDSIVSLIT